MSKMFKVISAVEKKNGGHFWIRCGSGFENKDGSMNLYLDVIPKNFQLQVRELDEDDLAKRDGRRTNHTTGVPEMTAAMQPAATAATETIPF